MERRPEISVVAPVYRETRETLEELYARVRDALSPITEDFELLLIEDGFGPSWPVIRDLSARDARVRGLALARNFGQHVAITAGLHACRGNWTVVMDSDLQDRPEVIPRLYEKALEGNPIVFVKRIDRPEPFIQRLLSRSFYRLLNLLSGWKYDPAHGNFSIISRQVVEDFRRLGEQSRFYGGMLQWLGYSRAEIEARHGTRAGGAPGYTLGKRARLALDVILAFSTRPLVLSVALGLVMSIASFAYGLYILVRALFLEGFVVPGWPSVMVAVFFNSGIVLIVLGIASLYIGRVLIEVKGRPLYVIAASTDRPDRGAAA